MASSKHSQKIGHAEKHVIRHQLLCPDIELRTKPGMFSCLQSHFEYTSLFGIMVQYDPIMHDQSYGKICITVRDTRKTSNDILAQEEFETDKKIVLQISGFDSTLTEDCCPIVLSINQELEGIAYDTAVGKIVVHPAFRSSNYAFEGGNVTIRNLECGKGKKFGGMEIKFE